MNSEKRRKQIQLQNRRAHEKRLKEGLTKKDIEIIKLIYQEKTSQEIGDILGKSRRTIDNHRLYIIRKIKCKNVVGVIKYAIANNLVPLPKPKAKPKAKLKAVAK